MAAGALLRPPGPRGPFILRAARARRDPPGFLRALASRYGDIVGFRIGPQRVVLVNDPAALHTVLVERAEAFTKAAVTPATRRLIGYALFAGDGPTHDRQRRAIQPLFRHERLEGVAANAATLSEAAAAAWRPGSEIEADREMAELSFRVMAANLFSFATPEEAAPLRAALQGALASFERTLHPLAPLLDRLPIPSTLRATEAAGELARLVDTEIAARKARPSERGDLLDLLVGLRLEGEGPDRLSDLETRHEAVDLVIASHETVSVALAWSLFELARHPKAQAQVARQAREALGDRPATLGDAARLTLARAAFQESLRLHPPAWAFLRRAKAGLNLQGYGIEAGTLIVLAPCVTHLDPRFFPNPDSFELDRFEAQVRDARPKAAYFPFGAGPRSCIGEPLAIAEGTLVLATLLRRVAFASTGAEVRERALVTLLPAGPIPLRVEPRA